MINTHSFEKVSGKDVFHNLAFTDINGSPYDITNFSLWLRLKTRKGGTGDDIVASIEGEIIDAEAGTASFHITDTITATLDGVYYFDMEYIDSQGYKYDILNGTYLFEVT
jgi:hypothetical protein